MSKSNVKCAMVNELSGHFEIGEIDIDNPHGREILIEVKASGLCHSDLHFAENDFGVPLPAVLGHELAGVVIAVGSDARDFAVGEHVVGSLIQCCGHCRPCVGGRSYQCAHPEETLRGEDATPRLSAKGEPVSQGFGIGAFAQYALVHENQLARVPKELPFAQASLLGCGTITGAGAAINTAQVRPGDTVVVIGIGGVGLNVISGAKIAGAGRIVAVDRQPAKEALARKFGATDFVDASSVEDAVEAVRELLAGGGDHVFEVVGIKPTSEQAIRMARKGGTAYMIGVHAPDATIEVNVTVDLLSEQVIVRGVYMGSSNIKNDIPMFADLYLRGQLNLDDLISQEIDISAINDAYAELKGGAIARSVITSF